MNSISGLYQPTHHEHLQHHHQQVGSNTLSTTGSTGSSASPSDSNNSNNGKYSQHHHQNHQNSSNNNSSLYAHQGSGSAYHVNAAAGAGSHHSLAAVGGQHGQHLQHLQTTANLHHHHNQQPQQQQQQQQQQDHHLQPQQQQQLSHQLQYGGHHTIDSTTVNSTLLGHGKKSVDKASDEYKKRRERNNVAVRKSREKAKLRSRETERRVAELSKENQLYRAQYEELRREFNVLKSLLLKTGLTEQVIEDEAQRHTMQQQINQVSNSVHNHMVVNNNHHIISSLNNHVGIKGANCNQVSNANGQPHYQATSIEAVDQWTDGINAYVEDWAS